MGLAMNVDDKNFDSEVTRSALPVLADFWAEWCQPCKMIAPMIDRIASGYEGKLKVVKVDVDSGPNTASSFGVRSIPTLIFFTEQIFFWYRYINESYLGTLFTSGADIAGRNRHPRALEIDKEKTYTLMFGDAWVSP